MLVARTVCRELLIPKISSQNGVWINARSLVTIGLPVAHEFNEVQPGGSWQVDISSDGEMHLTFVDGRVERFIVRKGDLVIATGDCLYASLKVTPGTPEGAVAETSSSQQRSS